MKLSSFTTITALLIFMVPLAPARAELLVNEWQDFAFPVSDDFDCAGEDGVASGLVHFTVTLMPSGNFGVHINANGIWKGNDSGIEFHWKENTTDIIPILADGEIVVWTIIQRLRVTKRGPESAQFRLKYDRHIIEVDGDLVVFHDEVSTVCTVP